VQWRDWRTFVDTIFQHVDPNTQEYVNKRYAYGELRLNRLNQIYRLAPRFHFRHLLRGYHSGHSSYGDFFRTKFAWIIVPFAYGSILLSAFQVGLATDNLRSNGPFQRASYGFVVFSILGPVLIAGLAGWLFVALFFFHLFTALAYNKTRGRMRKEWVEEKRGGPLP
jgi:hypothetical protein